MFARKLSAYLLVLLLTTTAFAVVSFGARADESSADAYGYYWTDSLAPTPSVTFSWVEISSTGTDVGFYDADNDYVGPLAIGFDFEFYGNTYSMFNVSCNGYLQFDYGSSESYNYEIPSPYGPDNIVAAFWDDLSVYDYSYNYGAVYYETIGTTPNQQLVVEFYEVSRDYGYDLLTFEMILNETGEIWFQYLDMGTETGPSATVGIENSDGSAGCLYSYGSRTIWDGLAVMFQRGLVGFGPDLSSMVSWGSSSVYALTLTNAQSITDSFDITVSYSELGWTVDLYDDSYVALIDNNGNGPVDTGDLAPGEQFQMLVYVTVPDPPSDQNETTVLLASSYADPGTNDDVTLTTRAFQARFSPPHSDYVTDSDVDGDYDDLSVEISVEAAVGGYLNVYAYLYGPSMDLIDSEYAGGPVPAGLSTITASFSGETIYSSMLDGPYNLRLYLYDTDWSYIDYDTHTTSSYLYTEFDPPEAMFVLPFSDYAPDEDLDGLYDSLIVNVTIEVFDAGYYTVFTSLYDWDWGSWLGDEEYSAMFTAGVYELQLEFSAAAINESTLNGICYLEGTLYLDNYTYISYVYYETASYVNTDFEGPGAVFVTPFDDYAEDTDLDGYDNHVIVTLYLECFETGLYDLEVWVYDFDWDVFDEVYDTVSLTAGMTVSYAITIDGAYLYSSNDWGDLYLEMYLSENSTSDEVDYEYYYTDTYYYWNFDPVGAYYYDYYDYGSDLDSNGYYDELVIELYIEPLSTGDFLAMAYVYDYWYDYMMTIEEVVSLEEGVLYTWTISLTAYEILTNGQDGYYYLDLYLYDVDETVEYDGSYCYTSYYYLDEFDPIGAFFVPPYDDLGRDDDLNGAYDYLVVTLYVDASSTGYYDVEVDVYDPWGGFTDYYWFELYLNENDVTEVVVEIPASVVWMEGANGYWYLEMYMYDHYSWTNYDYDSYSTGYYSVTDFDPPPVEFDPPHSDYGIDLDSDYLYDYLLVDVELDCYEAGTYTVYADLYDYWDDYITSMEVTEAMTVGNENVEFAFEGWLLYYNGVSGYYSVELTVEDESGTMIDYDVHSTDYYYYYYEFEAPPASFYPPHGDYALDDDGDSLYEYLIVNVSVEAYTEGDYVVVGILYDGFDDPVDAAMAEASLDVGVQDVQLWFDAWPITVAGADPWYVELVLYDSADNEMDTGWHYLGMPYSQSDFDPSIPTIESGWAYDAPVVDGTVSAGEWFGAAVVDLVAADDMNQVATTMYVLNNGTHLFVLIDVTGDTTESDGDMTLVSFDTGNDAVPTDGHEDRFAAEASDAGTYTRHATYDSFYGDWMSHCEPFDPLLTDHEGLEGAAGFGASPALATGHRVFELCIPMALLMVSPGDDIGFAGLPSVYDQDTGEYSTWPVFFWDFPPLTLYGDLFLSDEPPLTTVELSGDDGEEGWFVSEVEVTLTATGGTGGVANTSYSIDGAGWQTYADPFVIDDDGAHTVRFYSTDVSGNDEPVRSVQVMIDTVAPDTSASVEGTMGEDDWITSAATVEFTVVDVSSGLSVTMYRLDGGTWTELTGTSLEVADDGTHTLEFYSVDVAGHQEATSSTEFQVDMSAPLTEAGVDGSTVTLSVTDSGSGVSATMYRIDDGDWVLYEDAFEVEGKGNHTVEYYSVDLAGNNETVKTVEVEGASGYSVFGLDWWMVLLIGVIIILISIGVIFGMRRKAKDADLRYVNKDAISPMAQMMDDTGAPPGDDLPPPPDERG